MSQEIFTFQIETEMFRRHYYVEYGQLQVLGWELLVVSNHLPVEYKSIPGCQIAQKGKNKIERDWGRDGEN